MANRLIIRHGNSVPNVENLSANPPVTGLLSYEMGWYNDTLYINDNGTIKDIGGSGFVNRIINQAIGEEY